MSQPSHVLETLKIVIADWRQKIPGQAYDSGIWTKTELEGKDLTEYCAEVHPFAISELIDYIDELEELASALSMEHGAKQALVQRYADVVLNHRRWSRHLRDACAGLGNRLFHPLPKGVTSHEECVVHQVVSECDICGVPEIDDIAIEQVADHVFDEVKAREPQVCGRAAAGFGMPNDLMHEEASWGSSILVRTQISEGPVFKAMASFWVKR